MTPREKQELAREIADLVVEMLATRIGEPSNVVDIYELSTRIGVSVSTIKRMERRGDIQPRRMGQRAKRYLVSEVIESLSSAKFENKFCSKVTGP